LALAASLPEPRPLGQEFPVGFQRELDTAPGLEPTGELTLRQALGLALLYNPELAAFSWEVRVKEAQALQAGLWPNPELAVELENFAGSGNFAGFDAAESTVSLSQLIELGGKRALRRSAGALEGQLAGWDYETRRLDLLTATTQAFVQVLTTQERLALATGLARLAERIQQSVADRVEAGKVSPVERRRAQITLAGARLAEGRVRLELTAARQALSARWGSAAPAFSRVAGSLSEVRAVPPMKRLAPLVAHNPDVARWEDEQRQRSTGLELERANAVPDLSVFVGGRQLRESDESALVAGISIPLPIFDRNQGGIAAARAALSQARQQGRAAHDQALTALAESYQRLVAAHDQAQALKDEILPMAEEVLAAAELGYREGKFGLLDVLDAQHTFFETKGQQLDALSAYHQARAAVERLIATGLDTLTETTRQEN
jgi:cobalt-zinc-cadmium efflux system outer membrane protein